VEIQKIVDALFSHARTIIWQGAPPEKYRTTLAALQRLCGRLEASPKVASQ
jgi:hypothetical protein